MASPSKKFDVCTHQVLGFIENLAIKVTMGAARCWMFLKIWPLFRYLNGNCAPLKTQLQMWVLSLWHLDLEFFKIWCMWLACAQVSWVPMKSLTHRTVCCLFWWPYHTHRCSTRGQHPFLWSLLSLCYGCPGCSCSCRWEGEISIPLPANEGRSFDQINKIQPVIISSATDSA